MAAIISPILLNVFGAEAAKGIASVVQSFDFSKMDVKDSTRDDYLHTSLAPSYGTLNAESIKNVDKELKVMIAGTMRALAAIPPKERTWEKILHTMMQNPVLELDGTNQIARADRVIKEGTNVFKIDGSPDQAIVREVETWFTKLVSDEDVLQSTKIDIKVLANIVAQTGATVDAFETIFYKNEEYEKTMVDIGVLRFPDVTHPYFKLYRIQITAWSQSKRILFVQKDENGIVGEYNARNFKPRKEVIDRLSEEAVETATKEAESLFS